jgi:hypothetical protein
MPAKNNTRKREKNEQIPKEENIGEVQKAVSEQGGVEGQRKEVNVGDYVKTAAVGQLLKDLEFPVDKKKIIQFVQQPQKQPANIAKEKKEDILYLLQKNLEEKKECHNVSEVTRAAGLVQQ